MKRFLLIAIFLISTIIYAENSTRALNPSDQYEEATIHFHDGTSIKGYGKITSNYSIKFKTEKGSKPDIWTELMLKGITLHEDNLDILFLYVKVNRRKTIRLLEVIELGEISIFAEVSTNVLPFTVFFNVGGSGSFPSNNLGLSTSYNNDVDFDLNVKKENQEAINFTTVFKFRKTASRFFENCPQIVDKLKDKTYKRVDVLEMVYYYNDYCAALD